VGAAVTEQDRSSTCGAKATPSDVSTQTELPTPASDDAVMASEVGPEEIDSGADPSAHATTGAPAAPTTHRTANTRDRLAPIDAKCSPEHSLRPRASPI
jgi:hypothetical protein